MAIVLDSTTTLSDTSQNPAFAVTTPAGKTNQLLLACFGGGGDGVGNRTVSSVTYAAQTLTRAVGLDGNPDENATIYYVINPTAGSNTLTHNTNQNQPNRIGAHMLSGVNLASPVPNVGSQRAASANASITITSAIGHLVIDVYWKGGAAGDTIGADQTELYALNNSRGSRQAGTSPTGVMSWSWSNANGFAYLAVDIKNQLFAGSQAQWFFSKMRDFYRDLKAGLIPPEDLRRRYGGVVTI